ncbi:MAG TPA: hypothetical protein PKM65_04540 [Spirochaetota bacterium]|nr:hypothetical protein [Spirochaetota bacterium]HNT10651.1 hypothetical protein [Spirochaetota bacterium]
MRLKARHGYCAGSLILLALSVLSFYPNRDCGWIDVVEGRLIVQERGIPAGDPLSFATHDSPRLLHHLWLSDIVFHLIDARFGFTGLRALVPLMAFLFGIALLLFFATLGFDPLESTVLALAVFAVSMDRFRVRPHLFSMVFLFLAFAVLYRRWHDPRPRDMLALFGMSALWMNLHTEAIIFPATVSLMVIADIAVPLYKKRLDGRHGRLCLLAVALWLGVLCTPHHYEKIAFAIGSKPLQRYIMEYESPLRHLFDKRFPMAVFPVASALLLGFAMYKRKLSPVFIVAALPFLYLSIRHMRFIYMAGIPLGLALAPFVDSLRAAKAYRAALLSLGAAIVAFVLMMRLPDFSATIVSPRQDADPNWFPVEAVAFMKSRGIEGRIFVAERMITQWSSYLLYERYPRCTTFLDCRHVNADTDIRFGEFFQIYRGAATQTRLFDTYRVEYLLVDNDFVFHPDERDRWTVLHRDRLASVWKRVR